MLYSKFNFFYKINAVYGTEKSFMNIWNRRKIGRLTNCVKKTLNFNHNKYVWCNKISIY